MSSFDKLCGAMAFLLGGILLISGTFGLFAGCSASFTLPPVLGAIPAFVGWGIVRSVRVAWNVQRAIPQQLKAPEDV
jgi:hypothetical protein